jgi:RNA polymerase primary sigma factor
MFGIILTPRSSPATRRRPDLDRVILYPRPETTGPGDLEGPILGSRPPRPADGEPLSGLRAFESKARSSSMADINRARRLLTEQVSFIAHPSFDDPSCHDSILAPSPGYESACLDRIAMSREFDPGSSSRKWIPSREWEAHLFRKMNYLKCLACRIRDRIDPDAPVRVDLDEIERLHAEATQLKNQIVETHLRLVVSVARRHPSDAADLPDRIGYGTIALIEAVDHFDIARGNRFSTYATWAIYNELKRLDRREWNRRKRSSPFYHELLAIPDDQTERHEQLEAADDRRAAVKRMLSWLDGRERWVIVHRNGIGGVPERTLKQVGLDLGISKERVRQIEKRAHAKLRTLADCRAIATSDL